VLKHGCVISGRSALFVLPNAEGLSGGGQVFLQYVAIRGVSDVLRRGDRGHDNRCVCRVDSRWEAEKRARVGRYGLVGSHCGSGTGVCHGFDCKRTSPVM
jgi:hypothetical protein